MIPPDGRGKGRDIPRPRPEVRIPFEPPLLGRPVPHRPVVVADRVRVTGPVRSEVEVCSILGLIGVDAILSEEAVGRGPGMTTPPAAVTGDSQDSKILSRSAT